MRLWWWGSPRGDSGQHAALGSALNSTGAPAGYFQGDLDEARVWSVARSGAQVAASMSDESITGPGLVGRWALDDGAGTVVHGSVGIDGTTVGGPTWTSGFTISSPPSTPDLQAPTDGTTGLGTAVGLSAAVDDPAGQPMTVTFFGRPYASGTFAQVAMRTGIPPGQIVTTTWNDLGQGQRFEWYVVADNGSSSSRSAARTFWTASGTDPVLVGAGDIARCEGTGDEASGAVLSGVAGQVFTTGDNTYVNGT